ncbi:MAG TPA: sigma-70 family RNA polymerase sigma factor [Thermoanaerobaculia bacterium]|jgi:RNA polymerase sigma-70 factor (ECF subfamily)|nr:sigma-70 family RNA polymerase sigma factor [Thermoanaerobaculia bacterium]
MQGDPHEADDARISDATLIGRTAAGDRTAFERLVRRHQAPILRFARALAHDETDAEMALQETFLTAWRAAGRFRYDASARTWLLSIARHAIYRRHRRWADDPAPFVSLRELGKAAGWGIEDESFVDRLVDAEALAGALASLSPEDREILILRELEGLSPDEAAGVAGLSEGTARNRLHRARLRLMTKLRGDDDGREDRSDRTDRILAGLHCGEVLAELTAFLDGGLPSDRARRIQEHVKDCEDCERFGSEFSAAVFALREILREPERDEAVETRLLDRLRAEIESMTGTSGTIGTAIGQEAETD